MAKDDTWELIDTWEDFGMRYRGQWRPYRCNYDKHDVAVVTDGDRDGYFICTEQHFSDPSLPPDQDSWRWQEYGWSKHVRREQRPDQAKPVMGVPEESKE